VFILVVASLTSAAMYVLGVKALGLVGRTLGSAVGKMLECFGMVLAFCLINLSAGMLLVWAARGLTGGFVSLYLVSDTTVLVLSLIQGLTFHYWRQMSRHCQDAGR
jgi:hypothetical protein